MSSPGLPNPLAVDAVAALRSRGWTLATAESLTAGLLAATVAQVPGASTVLRGGLIVYATDLKHGLAGVPSDVLARHGAVSAETARALATGAAGRCGADIGVGLTGVAGPDRQEGQPAGTVHLGLCAPGLDAWSVALNLDGDRDRIRTAAVDAALVQIAQLAGGAAHSDPGDGNVSGS